MLRVRFLAILVFLVTASRSESACDVQAGTATKLRIPMVRAFKQCGWFDGEAPSGSTEAGIAACAPDSASRWDSVGGYCRGGGGICSGRGPTECPSRAPDTRFCYYQPGWSDLQKSIECTSNDDCAPDFFFLGCFPEPSYNDCTDGTEEGPSDYSFGPKGGCFLSAVSRVEDDCAQVTGASGVPLGLPQRPCHVTRLKARCREIVDPGFQSRPISADDDGWILHTLTRATLDDAVSGDSTAIDFPVSFSFETPAHGAIGLEVNTAEALLSLVGARNAALPPCTTLQVLHAEVADAHGITFAVPGLATYP